jgi:putative methyltransferase (TIGR04325 family)
MEPCGSAPDGVGFQPPSSRPSSFLALEERRHMNASARNLIHDYVPPAMIRLGRAMLDLVRPAPFEFVSYSWPEDMVLGGWQADGVQEHRERTWASFLASMRGNGPLGISEEELSSPRRVNTDIQSLYLSFGYCLALASHGKRTMRVLDWGGSVGNYSVIAGQLITDAPIEYHCADLPVACAAGRSLLPNVTFHADDSWKSLTFDFVFSSSSLQYLADWRPTVDALIQTSERYLFITRMPFVMSGRSFVMIQRARSYKTEYLGWVLNRADFVAFVEQRGMKLVRQFVNHPGPRIKRAPTQNLYMGFLFEK